MSATADAAASATTLSPKLRLFNYCLDNPGDSQKCFYADSLYHYRLSIGANATLLALFALSLLGFLAVYLTRRHAVAFTVALSCAAILEVLGYAGRVWSWRNQWDLNPFLMQICTLTIGPAFIAGGIYFCLRRIVSAFGPANSRIRPELYTRIFIPCDVVSLVLQAVGGAMTSIAAQNDKDVKPGTNIMVAGLAFQSLTMLVFMVVVADFAMRTWRRHRTIGLEAALDSNPTLVAMRATTKFRAFLAALAIATVCVFWRSLFRVAELSNGWDGPIIRLQGLFIGFEGVLVIVASLVLNLGHPALCARPLFDGHIGELGSVWGMSKSKRQNDPASSLDDVNADADHPSTERI